jgi:hypothetical protein
MNQRWETAFRFTVTLAVILATSMVAPGQVSGTAENSTANATAQQEQTPPPGEELAVVAVDGAAKAGKYSFIFFFRADDEQTQAMRAALESAIEETQKQVELVAVDVTDPLEKAMVNRFGVSRAPMPLILAVAPTGAVTRSWVRNFDPKHIDQAFVSPCEAQCLKALQGRKMVLVCVQNGETTSNDEAMQGVTAFTSDPLYARQSAVVSIDPTDESEAGFLKKIRVSPATEEAITVLMAPPGRPIATFTGATNKADIIAATKKAGSGCDPRSGCCAPKKPAG